MHYKVTTAVHVFAFVFSSVGDLTLLLWFSTEGELIK